MRAVIVADLIPNKIGSLESQIFGVGRILENRSWEVHYAFTGSLTTDVRSHFGVSSSQTSENLGELGAPDGNSPWLRVLERQSPDAVWTLFVPTVGIWPSRLRAVCPKARITIGDHVSRGFPRRSLPKAALCRMRGWWSGNQANAYLGVSHFVARRLVEIDYLPPSKVYMVHNGVDLSAFQPRSDQRRFVTAICHMRPEKGVPTLLEAIRLLHDRGIRPDCRLIGEGPHLPDYQRYCREHGLKNVEFLGRRNDVALLLSEAVMTVVPSAWPEAFGLAAAESLAAGVPVVATNIAALPEVVGPDCGTLVEPENALQLADAIAALLADSPRCQAMGLAARERAERLFDIRARCGDIADIVTGQNLQRV